MGKFWVGAKFAHRCFLKKFLFFFPLSLSVCITLLYKERGTFRGRGLKALCKSRRALLGGRP